MQQLFTFFDSSPPPPATSVMIQDKIIIEEMSTLSMCVMFRYFYAPSCIFAFTECTADSYELLHFCRFLESFC